MGYIDLLIDFKRWAVQMLDHSEIIQAHTQKWNKNNILRVQEARGGLVSKLAYSV